MRTWTWRTTRCGGATCCCLRLGRVRMKMGYRRWGCRTCGGGRWGWRVRPCSVSQRPGRSGGEVGLACATVFCEPKAWKERGGGYTTADEAHTLGVGQFEWYAQQAAAGHFRVVRSAAELPDDAADGPLPIILLLEGADPIRS